jgi:hypothetical protein
MLRFCVSYNSDEKSLSLNKEVLEGKEPLLKLKKFIQNLIFPELKQKAFCLILLEDCSSNVVTNDNLMSFVCSKHEVCLRLTVSENAIGAEEGSDNIAACEVNKATPTSPSCISSYNLSQYTQCSPSVDFVPSFPDIHSDYQSPSSSVSGDDDTSRISLSSFSSDASSLGYPPMVYGYAPMPFPVRYPPFPFYQPLLQHGSHAPSAVMMHCVPTTYSTPYVTNDNDCWYAEGEETSDNMHYQQNMCEMSTSPLSFSPQSVSGFYYYSNNNIEDGVQTTEGGGEIHANRHYRSEERPVVMPPPTPLYVSDRKEVHNLHYRPQQQQQQRR